MIHKNAWSEFHVNRKRNILFLLASLLFASTSTFAQYSVKVQLTHVPATHNADAIFITGNFNEWNPADDEGRFSKADSQHFLQFNDVPAGTYEFKFTRGSWQTVEVGASGADIGNRTLV